LHSQYIHNRNWSMLFNYTKTDNPYMKHLQMDYDINMVNYMKMFDFFFNKLNNISIFKLNIGTYFQIWKEYNDWS